MLHCVWLYLQMEIEVSRNQKDKIIEFSWLAKLLGNLNCSMNVQLLQCFNSLIMQGY